MSEAASSATSDVLTIERAEQLKALGHPLRLRVLELLGGEDAEPLTNRELAKKLNVDPGHLHFHVRMLLRAGLIERAEGGKGREKPYRAVAARSEWGRSCSGLGSPATFRPRCSRRSASVREAREGQFGAAR